MKPFIDSEMILRAAERLRPTCSFAIHPGPGLLGSGGEFMACIGDVRADGDTYEGAVRALARRVAERLAAQIDHDTQLMQRLLEALRASDG